MTSDDDNESSSYNNINSENNICKLKRKNSVYSFSKVTNDFNDSQNENSDFEDFSMDEFTVKKQKTNKIPYLINKKHFNCNNISFVDHVKLSEQFDHLNLKEN